MPRECSAAYEKRFLFRFLISSFRSHCTGLAPGLPRFVSSNVHRTFIVHPSSITNSPPVTKRRLADAKKTKTKKQQSIPENPQIRSPLAPAHRQPTRVVIGTKRSLGCKRGAEGSPALALVSVRGQQKIRVVVRPSPGPPL